MREVQAVHGRNPGSNYRKDMGLQIRGCDGRAGCLPHSVMVRVRLGPGPRACPQCTRDMIRWQAGCQVRRVSECPRIQGSSQLFEFRGTRKSDRC